MKNQIEILIIRKLKKLKELKKLKPYVLWLKSLQKTIAKRLLALTSSDRRER